MMFQPPFLPEPSDIELQVLVGAFHFINLIFLILLMIYFYQKILSILPITVLYMFSLVIGFSSFTHPHFPLSPTFEFFFLIFQTSMFVISALDIKSNKMR